MDLPIYFSSERYKFILHNSINKSLKNLFLPREQKFLTSETSNHQQWPVYMHHNPSILILSVDREANTMWLMWLAASHRPTRRCRAKCSRPCNLWVCYRCTVRDQKKQVCCTASERQNTPSAFLISLMVYTVCLKCLDKLRIEFSTSKKKSTT